MAESGGEGAVDPVELKWFNLNTGKVETARVEGFELSVDAPIATPSRNFVLQEKPWLVLLGAIVLGLIYLFSKLLYPRLKAYAEKRAEKYKESEEWAFAQALHALKSHELNGFLVALDVWSKRMAADPRNDERLDALILKLGGAIYGPKAEDTAGMWREIDANMVRVAGA